MSALAGSLVTSLRPFMGGDDDDGKARLGTILADGGLRVDTFDAPLSAGEFYVSPLAYLTLESDDDPLTSVPVDGGDGSIELPFAWKPLAEGERVVVLWLGDDPLVLSRALRERA